MSERIEDEDIAKWLKWARANGPTDRTMIPEIIDQLRAERDEARKERDEYRVQFEDMVNVAAGSNRLIVEARAQLAEMRRENESLRQHKSVHTTSGLAPF